MKSTLDQLSGAEKETLANLHGSKIHDVLLKLREIEILGLGADALVSPNHEHTMYLKGQTVMWNNLAKLIEEAHTKSKQKG